MEWIIFAVVVAIGVLWGQWEAGAKLQQRRLLEKIEGRLDDSNVAIPLGKMAEVAISGSEVAARRIGPDDLVGWGDTRWGMTDAELNVALGASAQPYVPKEGHEYTGVYVDRHVPGVSVASVAFNVLLQMDRESRTLVQVLFHSTLDPAGGMIEFNQVEEMLMRKYGTPTSRTSPLAGIATSTWLFPTTTIVLDQLGFSGVYRQLTIAYRPTRTSELDVL